MQYFHPSRSYFHDLDQLLLSTLNRLYENTHVTIKAADKNLDDLKCSIAIDLNRGNNSYSDENLHLFCSICIDIII